MDRCVEVARRSATLQPQEAASLNRENQPTARRAVRRSPMTQSSSVASRRHGARKPIWKCPFERSVGQSGKWPAVLPVVASQVGRFAGGRTSRVCRCRCRRPAFQTPRSDPARGSIPGSRRRIIFAYVSPPRRSPVSGSPPPEHRGGSERPAPPDAGGWRPGQ